MPAQLGLFAGRLQDLKGRQRGERDGARRPQREGLEKKGTILIRWIDTTFESGEATEIILELKLPQPCTNYPISSVEIWGGQMKLFEREEAKEY